MASGQRVNLILHQRDERRHDQRHAGQDQGRQLVTQRLASSRRKYCGRRTSRHEMPDHLALSRQEVRETKFLRQQRCPLPRRTYVETAHHGSLLLDPLRPECIGRNNALSNHQEETVKPDDAPGTRHDPSSRRRGVRTMQSTSVFLVLSLATLPAFTRATEPLDAYNVIWDTPSTNHHGSMAPWLREHSRRPVTAHDPG